MVRIVVGLVFVGALAVLEAGPVAAAGPPSGGGYSIGIAPGKFSFDNALRGGVYESTVTVINGSPTGKWFILKASGPAAGWIHIYRFYNNQVPARAQPLTKALVHPGAEGTMFTMQAVVPATAANGAYEAVLQARLARGATGGGRVAALVGVQADVVFHVTGTQVMSASVIQVYSYPKVEVGSALPVFVRVKNTGNVTVLPHFRLQISRPTNHGVVYHWAGTTGEAVLPGEVTTYKVAWPASSTYSQALGAYSAKLVATLAQGKSLGTWALPFRLYPYGSLHRGGRLLGLELVNKPAAGGQADVQASVESTGIIQQETSFVGQLYRDGSPVGAVKSIVPVLLAPKGQMGATGTVTVSFPVHANGLYRLVGTANFAGAQSRPATLSFRVGPKPLSMWYEVAGGVLLVVLGVLVFLVVRGRRRNRRPPTPPARVHIAPRYTASHSPTLHVPPRSTVGASGARVSRTVPRGDVK